MIHETYRTRHLIEWWVEDASRLQKLYDIEVFVCDPAEPAYIEQFQRAGLFSIPAINDIAPGIQAVQQRLRVVSDGLPRIFFYRDANEAPDMALDSQRKPLGTIQEFPGYIWPKTVDDKTVKEVPVKVNDHAMDAVRYAVMYMDAPTKVEYGPSIWG